MDLQFPDIDAELPVMLPPLRKLIAELTDCDDRGLPLTCAEGDLRACDIVLSSFFAAFRQSAENSNLDDNEAALLAEAFGLFQRLGQIFSVTYRSIRNNERELTILNILALIESLFQLEDLLQRQHTYSYEKPRLSPAAGINDILEAGHAVISGRRSWEFLTHRLERLRPVAEALMRQDGAPPAVVAHGEAVRQLVAVCANGDTNVLPRALDDFKSTGEALLRLDYCTGTPEHPEGFWAETPPEIEQEPAGAEATPNEDAPDEAGSTSEAGHTLDDFRYLLPNDLRKVAGLAEDLRCGNINCAAFTEGVNQIIDHLSELGDLFGLVMERETDNEEGRETWNILSELLSENRDRIAQALECFGNLNDPMQTNILDAGMEHFVASLNGVRQALLEAQKLESN